MRQANIVINNKTGLHARPASQLTALTQKFRSRVAILCGDAGVEADAKSIISLLSAGIKKGTAVRIVTEGDDENEAIEAIVALIEGFTE